MHFKITLKGLTWGERITFLITYVSLHVVVANISLELRSIFPFGWSSTQCFTYYKGFKRPFHHRAKQWRQHVIFGRRNPLELLISYFQIQLKIVA